MKQKLTKIYSELSAGKLSQQEALERIKALKLPEPNKPIGTLLATPVWEPSAPPASPKDAATTWTQHHIIVCDLPQIAMAELESLIPKSRCATVQTAQSGKVSEAYAGVALACFETIRRILKGKSQGHSFVQLVVAERDDTQMFAGLSGLVETATLENPGVMGQIVFVRSDIQCVDLARCLQIERNNPRDRVVRYTGDERQSRRWRLIHEVSILTEERCAFKEHGIYLITGGLGGLGILLAKEILHRTSGAKIVLSGRAAAADAKLAALESLQKTGRVEYRQVDVTGTGEVERLLSSIAKEYGQLNGIVHSAGIVRDAFILKKSSAQFRDVLQPKVAGTEHLDLASQAMELDFFVLFSSIASWAGNVGQADYAAANGFMEQFAGYRNALVAAGQRMGKTLAIAWPHWLEGGMNIDATGMALLEKRTGLRSLKTTEGMQALHHCLALPQSHVMVMRGDTADMRRALEAQRTARPETSPVAKHGAGADATGTGDLFGKTRAFLRKEFSAVLKIPVHKIETRAPLENYGIDSILAMNLTGQLEATFGALAKTLFFEYQTIDELADYFVHSHADKLNDLLATAPANIAKAAQAQPATVASPALQGQRAGRRNRQRYPSAPASAQAPPPANEPIAIVGLSGRYPESRDIEEFWRNLRDGKDCIVEVPKERWDWRQYYSEDRTKEGAHYSKWGGFIEGVDEFDPRFFNIAPREARTIDPQERLFLQYAWMAIEDAGYTRASLQIPNASGQAGQVGVYAGVMYGEYNLSGSLASIANRVSYFLNLHGPSLTLDTMCSSSLTAIHLACQDLRLGRTSLALAGGVNVSIHPNKYTMLSGGQFISNDGHCQSFGEGGGGYIPGEGVGVAVLKRLSDAERDGNHIYGVIRGSALNHGGKTNGYTVPNPQAQAEVIRRALVEARIDPRHVSYIEAHGTGTKLGDPIEIAALTKAFYEGAQLSAREVEFCLIGSAKSNIGHCESAAGIAGVTKVLLQMKHASIVPSLHSKKLNPHIDFKTTPFVVNQTLQSWEQPELDGQLKPRIAGISSFGAGGSNAHLIIEEYRTPEQPIATMHVQLVVPLSARTAEQLEQRVRDLLAFIERSERPIDLRAMAYTLQVGREAMEERAAFLAISIEDLTAKLKSFLKGDDAGGDVHRAQVKQHREALALLAADADFQNSIEQWIEDRKLPKLVELWVKGMELDWSRLIDAGSVPRLMSLPTYPFARERYWVEPPAMAAVATVQQTTVLHPLVHANTSNLLQQSYASRFAGSESFLDEGPMAGQKALPPLLVLEMIRAAVELASPQRSESGQWELRDTVWGEPLLISSERTVGIALFPRANDTVDVEIYSGTGTVDGADDCVHCQSHAVFSRLPAPARVDIARLKDAMRAQPDALHAVYLDDGQALAQVRLPTRSDKDRAEYTLHPDLLKQFAQLLDRVAGASLSPTSLECLRFVFACPENTVVWLRYSSSAAVDIDVCDEQGNVCVQMSGLCCESVAQAAMIVAADVRATVAPVLVDAAVMVEPAPATTPTQPLAQAAGPREIVLTPVTTHEPETQFEPVSKKPTGVRLLASAEVPSSPVAAKATVALSVLSAKPWSSTFTKEASRPVRLFELGAGVFSIEMETTSFEAVIEPLLQGLNRARNETSLKVLLLIGRQANSWCGDRNASNAATERRLFSVVAVFPCPVIAVVQGDAVGAGLLLASVCDLMVCSEDGQYGYTDIASGIFPSAGEERFFRERLGDAVADDLLYRSTRCSGRRLNAKGWACRVVPSAQVEADAQRLAVDLSRKSQLALGLLKTHLGRHLSPLVDHLAAVDVLHAAPRAAEHAVDSALVLKLGADREAYDLQALITDLKLAFDHVGEALEYKSVVLTSVLGGFLPQIDEASDAATVAELKHLVRCCPVPLIAAFESNADGLAWLFGLFCDTVVYSNDGRYSASALWAAPSCAREAAALCTQRLGASFGQEVCLTEGSYSGADLRARMGALVAVDSDEVMPQALRLAAFWDAWPRATVVAWKLTQTAHLQRLLEALPDAQLLEDGSAVATDPTTVSAPTAIALRSTVISATAHPEGVVVVSMQERDAKNMFSEALVSGLKEAFAHIAQTPAYKAVVLTGYDSYFATGGTMETLLAIQQGQAQFTDEKVFQLPMDCLLPVVAAIQGHGIGGGWSFGMFADLVVLSEESRYLSPYMGYGFTPGAGSTLMFPEKIGYDLARETLLTAQEISGRELKERGVPLPVLPRRDVVAAAIGLATRMARQPRARLIGLKRLWTHALRQSREDSYRREVEMHERTFVRNAETLGTIQAKFSAETAQTQVTVAKVGQPASSIVGKLKAMLAQELFLKPEEIDEDTQFIDLGLDSITGVTWIRKINAHYGTDIEATKVYSHPTLKQLSQLVASEAVIENAPAPAAAIAQQAGTKGQAASAQVAGVSSSTERESLDSVITKLKAMLAKELLLRPDEIEETVQFIDMGLDSITGVTWMRKINEHYRTDIEATKVYSHPTLQEIGRLVQQEAEKAGTLAKPVPAQAAPPTGVRQPVPSARRALASWRRQARANARIAPQAEAAGGARPIAVIGIAGQFPQAKNLDEFWANLAEGRNCIDEVSDARWSLGDCFQAGTPTPGKTNSKWFGALDEYDLFDPLFFNISPTEAECMDPQQRMFLQTCWHSIENAGYSPQSLSGSQCGVFVGCGPSDYHQISREQQLSAQGFTGAASSILAARISYFLNLRGPCIAIETACSSSLVAIANACDSLNTGNSDLALAGGVYVMAGPAMHIMTSQAGMLSTDGRCYTFDQRANGFVPGEGVGVLMLKRLADAERDQDRILGVIEGWGVNQDGKTNGITAPNEESQTRLLQSVYKKFGIDPAGIQLIEAHGTGTKLGDPIEVAGLKAAFKPFTDKSGYCALGSVKSNIGHCLTAAGAAGFIKLILALKHRSLPPTINYERRNEHIQLDGSPFYINDTLKPWNVAQGEKRRAAISSFGFSGTNAHLAIAEHVPSVQVRPDVSIVAQDGKIIVPLSARTESQLRQKAQDLLAHIRRNPSLDLAELAYTLQVGRDAMGERLGFLVGSLDALAARLEAYVTGEGDVEGAYQGQVKRNKEELKLITQDDEMRATIVGKWLSEYKLSKLLDLWVKGLNLDWHLLYGEAKPQRIELPNYPFAKDRYWLDAGTTLPLLAPLSSHNSARDILHPLLHKNTSLLSQQRYRSNFSGKEFFFDMQIDGVKVLSPLSLLEMAHAAVAQATLDLAEPAMIELSRISWRKPLFVAGDTELEVVIDLFANEDESVSFEIYTTATNSAGESELTVHVQGVACFIERISSGRVDIAGLRKQSFAERFDTPAFYAGLKRAGVDYGNALQGLQAIHLGHNQLLAHIGLPGALDSYGKDYALHPSLLEGAVQACMVFVSDANELSAQALSPVSIDSLTVVADCERACEAEMFAWIRYSDRVDDDVSDGDVHSRKLDVDIVDAQGDCRVAIRGLVLGLATVSEVAAALPETAMTTPLWDVIKDFDDAADPVAGKRILVIGANDEQRSALERHYRESTTAFVNIFEADTVADISGKLEGVEFDKLVWIASAHDVETLTEESIVEDQNRGILQVLRIMRSLTELGYEKRTLEWDLITINSLPVRKSDIVNPTHAGLQGFSGSMAEMYPRWKIRLFDLQEMSEAIVAGMRRLPFRVKNACYALRGNEWFCQKLIPVKELAQRKSLYRFQGVYVVIGGSGGLGEIWTRHVIERHQANVIWIGRRKLNDEIQRKIDSLSVFGKTPEYLQADASNLQELQVAYERIKEKYSTIHGIVHSAVGAFDQSLKTVSEDDFRSILSVKIDLSVRIAQVFNKEALDFVLFFSSSASFVRGAGMSGYSAGCAFKDAFALQLAKRWDCDIKVVNWGYWSVGAGDAMTDAMKAYFYETGYRPLDPEEGMKALDQFLASGFDQMSIGKNLRPTAEHLDIDDEWMASYDDESGRVGAQLNQLDIDGMGLSPKFHDIKNKAGKEMEDLLSRLLRGILDATPNILRSYDRWLMESKKIVAPYVRSEDAGSSETLERLWGEWGAAMKVWLQDGGKKALCLLVDKSVRALPDILTGKQKATDVIFPKSSLELVENVYKTDTIGLAYNESLSDTLMTAVRARLKAEPDAQIRLLEIGAGTGATTVGIIEKLEPYQSRIAEYCYTDLSKAFLFHAENVYAPRAPYLRTQIFNVEQPIAQQNIEAGRYDFVIAANVLHATKNIRNTLRNAKAVLRKNGMLLLNEISDKSICGHVTFGLLDGWWLNEDDEIRIPGSPGLYPEAWKNVLEEEGFHSVLFPCKDVHAVGQQIVVAFSDGVVRQRQSAVSKQPAAKTKLVESRKVIAPTNRILVKGTPAKVAAIASASAIAGQASRPHTPTAQSGSRDRLYTDELLREKTVQFCKQLIGKALKISSHQIDAAEPLESYGIDSIIVGLVNQQLLKYFSDVSATLLYEFQTVDALSDHLARTRRAELERLFELDRSAPDTPPPIAAAKPTDATRRGGARMPLRARVQHSAEPARPSDSGRKAIAIIGISGLYPLASSLEEFWENLKSGKNCITEIPENRWSLNGFYEPDEQKAVEGGKSYCKWGSFVDQFAEFDTLFFGIPPREALNMDPQERLFMQASWSALENSGYTRSALKRKFKGKVGVFAGITRTGYNLYRNTAQSDDKFWPRTSFSSVANRLSYFLDINGPSLPVDTMCSSSLTAIHEACEHIHNGDCDLAFAGGVNLYLHPTSYVDMSSQHMLSKDGVCKSFGEGANGFVPGEGVGVVLLKSLDRAVDDNDVIHGVILATHVNHGGKTNGFTVPNPVAQAELVRIAIEKAGISARDISYIEAHGTGTELGDPIEIAGLQQAFAKDTQDKGFCRIGSAKSNLGHLEAAAGIAALTKVLLQLRHQQIVPSLHASAVNPHIKFDKTPFEVNQALVPWEQPVVEGKVKPRIAGISSFGAGGANAHVIVQEYQPVAQRAQSAAYGPDHPMIVPLSAKTSEQLQQKASDLLDFLGISHGSVDLGAIAYTLQIGREPMEMRVGFVVDSVEQLTKNLSAYVYGKDDIEGAYRGQVQRNNDGLSLFTQDEDMSEAIDKWIARKKYSKLLELWVKGLDFDWNRLYGEAKQQRIQLPTYPFAKDKFWLDSTAMSRPASGETKIERKPATPANLQTIEDIINKIDEASIEATQGVRLLKKLV